MKMKDIELLIKMPEKVYNALTHTEFDANLVVDEMRKSIANGTPLVRCKECKYYQAYTESGVTKGYGFCVVHGMSPIVEEYYCADGERRDPCS